MYFTPEDNALVDEIFALEIAVSNAKTGEDAILLSAVTQPEKIRRCFYLSANKAFRESYLADLKRLQREHTDIMPKVYRFLGDPAAYNTEEIEAFIMEEFQDADQLVERYPLLAKAAPPLRDKDAVPPVRSMEFRMRLSLPGYSQRTRDELKRSFAALKAEGTTPLRRQIDILAQLEGFSCAAAAEAARVEAMLDLAYGDEESLCGGEI